MVDLCFEYPHFHIILLPHSTFLLVSTLLHIINSLIPYLYIKGLKILSIQYYQDIIDILLDKF